VGEPIAEVGYLSGDCVWDGDEWIKRSGDSNGVPDSHAPYVATTPYLYNVTMTSANVEYSQAMPGNCKKFTVKCRGEYDIKLAFTLAESGTTYITIPSGQNYWDDLIRDVVLTLYFQCATAAQVVEIVAWN